MRQIDARRHFDGLVQRPRASGSLHDRSEGPNFLAELMELLLDEFEPALKVPVDVALRSDRIRLLWPIVAETTK